MSRNYMREIVRTVRSVGGWYDVLSCGHQVPTGKSRRTRCGACRAEYERTLRQWHARKRAEAEAREEQQAKGAD